VITGPTPIKGVERTNAVVVRGQRQGMGVSRRDPYAMKMDRERNCYACRGFGHMACYCRNWRQRGRIVDGRRVEYGGGRIEGNIKQIGYLKEVENLESLD